MKSVYDIIRKPVISERSMEGVEIGKYVFEVQKSANKVEIKKAIETIFGVKVASVNTITLPGKMKRMGATSGRTPSRKKAVITLKSDSKKIEIFEGMF